jgi:hypothetical protein
MGDKLNQYRFFPRAFAIFYLYWMGRVIEWGMSLPELTNAQAAFIASVVTGAAAYFKFYVESGAPANDGEG